MCPHLFNFWDKKCKKNPNVNKSVWVKVKEEVGDDSDNEEKRREEKRREEKRREETSSKSKSITGIKIEMSKVDAKPKTCPIKFVDPNFDGCRGEPVTDLFVS